MPSTTFSTPGTFSWTAPANTFQATIKSKAPGGGAASSPINGGGSGGGGGGGGYTILTVAVVPSTAYTVFVGQGGAAGTGDGGVDGEDTYVSTPTEVRAHGGKGAFRTSGGAGGSGGTFSGAAGGAGIVSSVAGGGGGGGAANETGTGIPGGDAAGALGGTGGDFGGGAGGNANSNGTGGTSPGGGGGGGGINGIGFFFSGGAGGNGEVYIEWTPSAPQQVLTVKSRIAANTQKTLTVKSRITSVPQSGYSVIRFSTAPAMGHSVSVSYYRLGADLVACEDTPQVAARAAIEGGTGKYQMIANDSSNTNQTAALQETQKALQQFGTLPDTLTLRTYRAGILPGMYLTVSFAAGPAWDAPATLNGTYLVQQVSGTYNPGLPDSWGHSLTWDEMPPGFWDSTITWDSLTVLNQAILYTLTLISVPSVPNWVTFWVGLKTGT